MILHVLPGDAYVDEFRKAGLEGDVAIFRESLVDGDLSGESLPEFWSTRERYHASADPKNGISYRHYVTSEIEKIFAPGAGDEINLWFEYELFCSVNYWFCLHQLRNSEADIYRVAPTVRDEDTKWKGFGQLTSDEMLACYGDRAKLSQADLSRGSELWCSFKSGDLRNVRNLGSYRSAAFPYLKEVADAAAGLHEKPKQILRSILEVGEDDIKQIFPKFTERAGVYGFGDSQVERILSELRSENGGSGLRER